MSVRDSMPHACRWARRRSEAATNRAGPVAEDANGGPWQYAMFAQIPCPRLLSISWIRWPEHPATTQRAR